MELLDTLNRPQHRYTELDRYASGRQKLAYLSPEARIALPALNRIVSNIPGLAVTSLAERLRVTGFKGVDIWDEWLANDLDQASTILHREALTFGDAFVIVWARPDGSPLATVESPQQVAVIKDPATREIESAVKRWRTKTEDYAVLYLPDRVERWRARTAEAANTAFELVETLDNPLGVVPVVNFCNASRILGCGRSELDDLIPLVDGLNATLAGLAVAQEFTARPRRWATGIELVEVPKLDGNGDPVVDDDGNPVMETVNPIPEGNRAMIAEGENAKFGQLPGADLKGYENAVNIWLGQIMAVSALPAHFVGITTENPSSAEALRASESSLTARAEARQAVFGRSWEQVARLMVAIRDGVAVDSVDVNVVWGDPASRSVAAEADSVTKLYQSGLLSRAGALRRLGYSEDEIEAERRERLRDDLSAERITADMMRGVNWDDLNKTLEDVEQ
ncbi:hypothetical protein MELE44368_12385 [Mycolicibacterium elephantis DSM 44368]|uniref:Phage portal protein n=1 Tax=Mycolicibacterium elephantis DSM 44368 TaxID=1335622 RepID=A0A439DYC9_9MYCO|nr:hypothetical protein MELE44368_12385 [Mycolicibacterium elephantis DSM 44368]